MSTKDTTTNPRTTKGKSHQADESTPNEKEPIAGSKEAPEQVDASPIEAYCAEAAHEANRAYRGSIGEDPGPTWEDFPVDQKASVIKGVGLVLANPNVTNAELHQSWLNEKAEQGWVYGEVKDAEAKTHPCIMPYEDLPEEQRVKDEMFRETVLRTYKGFTDPVDNSEPGGDTPVPEAEEAEPVEIPEANFEERVVATTAEMDSWLAEPTYPVRFHLREDLSSDIRGSYRDIVQDGCSLAFMQDSPHLLLVRQGPAVIEPNNAIRRLVDAFAG